MKLAAAALLLAACTTQDNLGNHVFGDTRWSISLGSPGEDGATAIAVDPIGNVIVAGTCHGDLDFGSGAESCEGAFITQRTSQTGAEMWTVRLAGAQVGSLSYVNDTIVAVGSETQELGSDQFIAIFDTSGHTQSITRLGLVGTVVSPVGATSRDGWIFATGGFEGSVPSTDVVTSVQGDLDGYVTSHYHDATPSWSVGMHGAGPQLGTAIGVTPDNHIAVLVAASAPFTIGGKMVASRTWPASLLLRLAPSGDLTWARALPDQPHHLAVTPDGDMIVAGCPTVRAYNAQGGQRWAAPCNSDDAQADALAIADDGTIVLGGHHADAAVADGELFLDAYDADGNSVGGARTAAYADPTDSQIAATAIEPSGEIVFTATASHDFDFGNGMLANAGYHDVVVVKLDSFVGRDGPILLANEVR